MRWIHRRNNSKKREQDRLTEARQERAEVKKQGADREKLVQRLEFHAQRNHFAERFEMALARKRKRA